MERPGDIPDGWIHVQAGASRGVAWQELRPDSDVPPNERPMFDDSATVTELWRIHGDHGIYALAYDDSADEHLVRALTGPIHFDRWVFEMVSQRPPQAMPTAHYQIYDGNAPPVPLVEELPQEIHVLFEELEIELVDQV